MTHEHDANSPDECPADSAKNTGAGPDKKAATAGGEDPKEPLTSAQEAFLLPILTAAHGVVQREHSEGKVVGGVGCGWLIVAIVAGLVSAQAGGIPVAGAVVIGLAVAGLGFVPTILVLKQRTSSLREVVVAELSSRVDLNQEQLAKLFDLCAQLETRIRTCHDAFLEVSKKYAGMYQGGPIQDTKFRAPPEGLASRRGLLALAQLLGGDLVKPQGFDEGIQTGLLKGNAQAGQKTADEIAALVRDFRP
jgi:hypothetical protein